VVKYTPIFTAGVWQNLYLVKIQNFVLAMITHITTTWDVLEARVNTFSQSLVQSRLEIPIEVCVY
jgi:hypothetical protein